MATPSPNVRWTEADYRKAGLRKLGIRVGEITRLQLAEIADALGVSQGEALTELIAAEYERLEGKQS